MKSIYVAVAVVSMAWGGAFGAEQQALTLPGSVAYNEIMAINNLRTIAGAQQAHHALAGVYAKDFDKLMQPTTAGPACLEGPFNASPLAGYVYHIAVGADPALSFSATAAPWKPGVTGKRSFFVDESLVLRGVVGDKANADSETVKEETFAAPAAAAPAAETGHVKAVIIMKTLVGAQVAHHKAHNRYAGSFEELLEPLDFLSRDIAWPEVDGYRFAFMPVPDPRCNFAAVGEPLTPGKTGVRWLYVDASGVVRWSETPAVGPTSAVDGANP